MAGSPPSGSGEGSGRLHRCIRDLAALNALPSMCIGRSPDAALDIVLEALPTALSCELVRLTIPGAPPIDRATLRGTALSDAELAALDAALANGPGERGDIAFGGGLWCLDAEMRVGAQVGRFLAGRSAPPDPETDRVLVRSAANLAGTTLETAHVLESARRKDEFLAMLGHELRNPLAPILTASEILARHESVSREQQIIDRNTRHLARLVDDLLDISRVTRGHVELRREPVSLRSVLERAAEIAAPYVARGRHTLDIAAAPDTMIEGDPVRLAQVFGNLLTNAAKFTPPGGRIDVSIERAPGRARVRVRDTGRGIERDQLRRIFEPFVQVDRERDALRGGLGLGLAIVSNLVERHGGSIRAESEGRGRGATFTVELPTTDRAESTPRASAPAAVTARKDVRVLVVDDNVDIAELLSMALELEGFQTAVAYDARAALDRWRQFTPHAGVLDVGLPEIDGYDLARTLRAEHGRAATLIAATGYGEQKDRLRAVDAGFDLHFVKPVSVEDLVSALDQRVVRTAAQ